MPRPANPENPRTRSYRVGQVHFDKARRRAASEGFSMSAAVGELVAGYAAGVYDLPTKRVTREYAETSTRDSGTR